VSDTTVTLSTKVERKPYKDRDVANEKQSRQNSLVLIFIRQNALKHNQVKIIQSKKQL